VDLKIKEQKSNVLFLRCFSFFLSSSSVGSNAISQCFLASWFPNNDSIPNESRQLFPTGFVSRLPQISTRFVAPAAGLLIIHMLLPINISSPMTPKHRLLRATVLLLQTGS